MNENLAFRRSGASISGNDMRCRDPLLCSVALGLALGIVSAPVRAEQNEQGRGVVVPPLSAAERAAAFAPVLSPPAGRNAKVGAIPHSRNIMAAVGPKRQPVQQPDETKAPPAIAPADIAAAKPTIDAHIVTDDAGAGLP